MRTLIVLLLIAITMPTYAAAETLTGTVTYLQRMMLPPGTTIEVQLLDVSLADAPSKTLATYRIESPGAPPYDFAFEYDPARIDPRDSYVLRAMAIQGNRLLMTTDTAYPVLTRGAGSDVELVMRMVERTGTDGGAAPDSDFVNTYWKILTLGEQSVTVVSSKREPHLILRADGSYNATVGCNLIRGAVDLAEDGVTFHPGATTMMACVPPLDLYEAALGKVLAEAAGYRIEGESMNLVDAAGATLATFEAVYF